MRRVVLVTAIGTVTATSIVRELRKAGGFHIIGADINNRHEIATSLEVDEFYQFPLASDGRYVPFAIDFCQAHDVNYYYAVIDKEVLAISQNQARFEEVGTCLCIPEVSFVRRCHFKNDFCSWMKKAMPQVAIRQYEDFDAAKLAEYPLFIKPVEGVASSGCRRVDSPAQLEATLSPDQVGVSYLIQDYVEGTIVTVDCVRSRKTGQMEQAQRRELLRNSNGCGIAVETIHDEGLEEICNRLMAELDLNGVCNMEFFSTSGGYKIIEVNPRFSAGTAFSCMAGFNTVMAAMDIADGRHFKLGRVEPGLHFAERYEAYQMD